MNILIINCGSSSLGFKVYRVQTGVEPLVIASGKARNVVTQTKGTPLIDWRVNGTLKSKSCDLPSHAAAGGEVLSILSHEGIQIDAIGHRFVHGGDLFSETALVNDSSLENLRRCLPLAPIHNPNSMSVIEVCLERLPGIPQYAVFDTAFHAKLPLEARTYAIPRELAEKRGLRKFGFHGLSCEHVSLRAAQMLAKPIDQVKLILCHLGTGGSSVTAFRDGHSVETSMGFSPLAGLVMSTRCGDIDGEVVLELVRQGFTAAEVSRVLNNESGLIGLSGFSSNLAEVIEAAEAGNEDCRLAYDVYANRLKFYLGAYTWLLAGADAIVFTDDVGIGSWKLRERVCNGEETLGVQLDPDRNRLADVTSESFVNREGSPTKILVIPTDEEKVILKLVLRQLKW